MEPGPLPPVADLVAQLESLVDGPAAVLRLAARGTSAVEPLRHYLLEGRITSLFQPRCWAVDALVALGARDALLEYLAHPRSVPDPVLRQSEDAVENAAARALAAWPSEAVLGVLLERASARLLPGLVEALGAYRRPEALPLLIHALEDDACRLAAAEGLRALGRAAGPALARAALNPWPGAEDESPSSLRRRRGAVELLAEGEPEGREWPALRRLLLEDDPGLAVAAARLAARAGPPHDRRLAATRLIELAGSAPWPLSGTIEDVLVELGSDARGAVEAEISRLSESPGSPQGPASAFALLRRVLRRAAPP